ncbi:MAG TPA: TonB-dependent receptor, partial [Burkholderiaceae bacterium]|nr:TonB-dependent receptor [Burkholderiaceae bacterium]
VDWFGNAMLQVPLAHDAAFRPGSSVSATAGLRYTGLGSVVPQAQFNARFDGRESGAESDAPNSGSTLVYFSPGLSWATTPRLSVYAFAQVPVYQRVNGLQLEPRWSASAGVHVAF